jgi:hypothetical protein
MSDSWVRLSWSDDGGRNWTDWEVESLGEVGEYEKQVIFTRMGQSRQRVYKIRVTSPRKRDLLGGVAILKGTQG